MLFFLILLKVTPSFSSISNLFDNDSISFSNKIIKVNFFLKKNNLDSASAYLQQSYHLLSKDMKYNNAVYNAYKAYFFRKNTQYDSAYYYYTLSLNTNLKKSKKTYNLKSAIHKSLGVIANEINDLKSYRYHLYEALEFSKLSKDSSVIAKSLNNLGVFYDKQKNFNQSISYYKDAIKYTPNKALLLQNIGSCYLLIKKLDSAKFYLNKALETAKDSTTTSLIYLNLSRIKKNNNNNKERIQNLFIALKYSKFRNTLNSENRLKIYNELSNAFREQNDFKNALSYSRKYYALKDSLQKENIIDNINNLNIKYETEKKEKENLQLKQQNFVSETKRKQSQNLFYGALLILISGGIIAYLNLKNSKRKRLLAEQQKELETQKNITLIKEQEITTINAMIDGQEKERVRIAEDLHDNIGSVLATLKLHFENLKLNREKKHFNQEELYDRTEKLIDETYLKVRGIAHAKNAGVIANQGLLYAVKIMADKISSANKIKINVIDFGLDQRLENSIEITAFRIIQELTTNIIKHAEAKEATINIALFDKMLNIIVEDDGKGFDPNEVPKNNSMGLGSIEKRITHLKGTLQIDATVSKGTTIIINIPVA